MRRGFALAYVLVVSVVLFLFTTALYLRASYTLRATRLDENFIRARQLADTGAKLTFTLMRDYDAEWYLGQLPLTNNHFGPDYAQDVLGGTFEVTVVDKASLAPSDPYPSYGTYRTIIATGQSGGRTARTAITAKITNPFLNYLILSPLDLKVAGVDLTGPIVVNANPDTGDQGNFRIIHDKENWNSLASRWSHGWWTVRLNSEVRATGEIYIQNDPENGFTQGPMFFDGTYPVQSFTHDDMVILDPTSPGTAQGRLLLTGEFTASPKSKFNAPVPSIDQLIKNYRDNQASTSVVDVTGYPDGVLAEFIDGTLFLSQATKVKIGRVYDRDFAQDHIDDLTDYYRIHYGVGDAAAQQLLWREVAWDDPDFEDDLHPGGTSDLDGDGIADVTDFIEQWRIVRGPPITSIGLTDANWTVIYLKTSRTDYPSAGGVPTGPPVYVRGVVDGKAVLVYDVAAEALDANHDRLPMMILASHEAPTDNPGFPLAATGPGVPGGLRFADRNIKTAPDSTAAYSEDGLVLLSHGWLRGSGITGVYQQTYYDDADGVHNHFSELSQLDSQYSSFYTGIANDPDFKLARGGSVDIPFYGTAIGGRSDADSGPRFAPAGELVMGDVDRKYSVWKWSGFDEEAPAWANENRIAIFCSNFRGAADADSWDGNIKGSVHSLSRSLDLEGVAVFDYKGQAYPADEIKNEMLLKLFAVPLTFQRL